MQYGARDNLRGAQAQGPIAQVTIPDRKRRLVKSRQHTEHGLEQTGGAPRAHHRQWWPVATFELGVDDLVEEVRNEIRKVIGMVMRKQNVGDPVPVHTGFDQVHQRSRAEIQQERLIGLNQISGCRPRAMDICA
jgi:hypothetical protein